MSPPCVLIVFAKAPLPGQVKTRLVSVLGAPAAARLAARMLDDTLQRARAAGLGPVALHCTPDTTHPQFQAAAQHGIRLALQGDGDLGMRMQRALTQALEQHPRVLLIGTDAPQLGPPMLRAAADALLTHDAVAVPARDGGYVLIGLSRPCPALFQQIAWSTPQVMQQTRERAAQAGIMLAELPAVHDIDEPQDLIHVPREWLE